MMTNTKIHIEMTPAGYNNGIVYDWRDSDTLCLHFFDDDYVSIDLWLTGEYVIKTLLGVLEEAQQHRPQKENDNG
jgi:hypothetical protein